MDSVQIADSVLVLNYEWFTKKKDFFKKEPFYNNEMERINEGIPDYEANEEKKFIIIDMDLPRYCWDCYYPMSLQFLIYQEMEGNGGHASITLPVNGKEVANEILSNIITYTKGFTDIRAIHNFIALVLEGIKNNFITLLNGIDDSEYEGVLDYYRNKFLIMLGIKFGHIRKQFDLVTYYEEKLEFNLTQEQLAALLLILNKAGFLNTVNFNDTGFLRFCQQFFYFKLKNNYKRPNSFRTLSDKYREFIKDENPKTLEKVKQMLQKALNEI
jgi:hypothetical protein